ncbi:MAG TPA: hypothetical protein PLL00_08895 [Bacteroidia bacterium]|nr:hypothetical protein [Bacteroidia bacterium]
MKKILLIVGLLIISAFSLWGYANYYYKENTDQELVEEKKPMNFEAIMLYLRYHGKVGNDVSARIRYYFPEIYSKILANTEERKQQESAAKEERDVNDRSALEGTTFTFNSDGIASRKLYGVDLIKVLQTHRFFNGSQDDGTATYPGIALSEAGEFLLQLNQTDPYYIGNITVSYNGNFLFASTKADYSYKKPQVKLYPIQENNRPFKFKIVIEDRGQTIVNQTIEKHCNVDCNLGCTPADEIKTRENRD